MLQIEQIRLNPKSVYNRYEIFCLNTPFRGKGKNTHDQLFTILLYLSSSFAMSFSSEEEDVESQLSEEFNLLLRKKGQLSRQMIFTWAENLLGILRSRASYQLENSHQQIAIKVRSFIQDHLAEGISLQNHSRSHEASPSVFIPGIQARIR